MSLSMPDLFTNLKAGDLLMIPVELPLSKEKVTAFATVLRVGPEGELYLSCRDEHRATIFADACCNPFRWDPKKGALVDKDGEVPRWYTIDIMLERGGAAREAALYAEVPRLEHMRPELAFTDVEFKRLFLQKDDRRAVVLNGLLRNGEAGGLATQLMLALDVLGVQYSQQQAMGITYFMESLKARRTVHAALINLPEGLFTDGDGTNQSDKSTKH
jgi:hypothetical protein